MKTNKICHCANCDIEAECHDNEWSIYNKYDPCCPNMKQGRKEEKEFIEEYLETRL